MPSSHPTLSALAEARTLKMTTIGRKTGKRRTSEIWFVVEGNHLFVQAGKKARKGWLANIRSNPEVDLDIDGTELHGRASVISDPAEGQRVLALFRQKYWLARVASWVGAGIGGGVPVRIEGPW